MKKELLSKEETIILLERWQLYKDEDALATLVFRNMSLVSFFAQKYLVTGIPFEDLESIGKIGLIKGINNFDTSQAIEKFSTYIGNSINNTIKLELRSHNKRIPTISFDQPIYEDKEGDEICLYDTVGTPREQVQDEVEKEIISNSLSESLNQALNELSQTEKSVLIYRFGIDGSKPKTQEDVAKLLGISQQWVQKTEAKALRKLKVKECSKNLKEFL